MSGTASRRAWTLSRNALASALCLGMALSPLSNAFALESAQPAESFTFSDATPAAGAAADTSSRAAAAPGRKVPVSSSGSFPTSVTIDVPPGRRSMTPSLALSYDSSAAQQESAVGLGWGFGVPSISRSTRTGFPPVTASDDETFAYDDDAPFAGPAGEIVRAETGEAGPTEGDLFAPLRESSPVRYTRHRTSRIRSLDLRWESSDSLSSSFQSPVWSYEPSALDLDWSLQTLFPVQSVLVNSWVFREWVSPTIVGLFTRIFIEGVRWVEHDPSGVKRYYGTDPFTGAEAKIKNELGEAEWLLVREEDPFGNAITYEYHHIDDQDRSNALLARAQQLPVLKRVAWGQNRLTGIDEQFWAMTSIEDQDGPIDMLNGHTILTSRITSIKVGKAVGGPVGETYWDYKLNHEASPTTGRLRLASVERIDHSATSPTYRKTTFTYEDGGPNFENSWEPLPNGLGEAYSQFGPATWSVSPSQNAPEGAVNALGFRSATKFLDYDGDGKSDVLYHGAGLGVLDAQVVPGLSQLDCGNDCADGTVDFSRQRASTLADLDGDGDVDPLSLGEELKICWPKGAGITDADRYALQVDGVSPIPRIESNATIASGLRLRDIDFLPNWPSTARRSATVSLRKINVDKSNERFIFSAQVNSDVTAPIADLNGDGRPDISLLKTFELSALKYGASIDDSDRCMSANGTTTAMVYSEADGVLKGVPTTMSWELAQKIAQLPRGPAPRPMRRLLRKTLPRNVVRSASRLKLYSTVPKELAQQIAAERVGTVDLTELQSPEQMFVMSGGLGGFDGGDLGGFGNSGGWRGMPGGWRGMPNPLDDSPLVPSPAIFDGRGLRFPWNPDPGSAGGGKGCIGVDDDAEAFPKDFRFVPRVYLSTGTNEISYEHDADGFSRSIQRATGTTPVAFDGLGILYCWADATGYHCSYNGVCLDKPKGPYVTQTDFNSFFLDVNGDSLPDLVIAEPPTKDDSAVTSCVPGHRVLINRGYRFEWREPSDTEEWLDSPWQYEQWSAPLKRIKNRGGLCAGTSPGTKFEDVPLSSGITLPTHFNPEKWGVPMSAVSPVDIDGDRRVDIVTAYDYLSLANASKVVAGVAREDLAGVTGFRRILRNTGRGFEELSRSRVDAMLHDHFYLADIVNVPGAQLEPGEQPTSPDAGRIVDLDSDGLVDLVRPGVSCPPDAPADLGLPIEKCTAKPAKWIRNTGAVPDMLTGVRSSMGSFTKVTYGTMHGDNVSFAEGTGIRPPPSMRLVTSLETGTVPESSSLAGAPPVQVVTLEYDNYVRDPVSREQLGFEKVTAKFRNSFGGEELETVKVEQRYDVRATVEGIALRHPLKGALVESVTTSSDSTDRFTTTNRYKVWPLGDGVRIRSDATFTQHCVGLTECEATGSEVTEFDSHGYPKRARQGDSDGAQVLDGDAVETETTYGHKLTPWILGLPKNQKTRGNAIDFDGIATGNGLLGEVARTYTGAGLIETVRRPSFQAEGCESAGMDDLVRYTYTGEGLRETTTMSARGRLDTTIYAADQLYPESQHTAVTRYVDGVVVGTAVLKSSSTFDRRTGASTSVTDPNGVTTITERDSLGRELGVSLVPAPNAPAVLLRKVVYDDDATPTVETTSYRTVDAFTQSRTHLDGAGNVLGIVEKTAQRFVRRAYAQHDSFGRVVLSALPTPATGLQKYEVLNDERFVETLTDGFNRTRAVIKPDETTASFDFGPRWVEETNARGYVTRREFNWRGDILHVERRGDADAVLATHSIQRDGLGRITAVEDADKTIRRFERDLGGRLRFASLPHDVGATPLKFAYCFDAGDGLVWTSTPEGRDTTLTLDELGRVVSATSVLLDSEDVSSTRSYDDPAVAYGLGRLTRLVDSAGTTVSHYDALGRLSRTQRTLPGAFFGDADEPIEFEATFDHDFAGNLERAALLAPEGGPLGDGRISVDYARDSRGRATSLASGSGSEALELVGKTQFDPAERLTGAEFGNGVTARWSYDAISQRLTDIEYEHDALPLAAVSYPEYNEMGNLEREQRFDEDGEVLSEKVHTYDALERLHSSHLWHPLGSKDEIFTYSPAGNINTAGLDAYEYERADLPQSATRLSAGAGVSRELAYDADGHLVSDAWILGESAPAELEAQDRAFTWDAAGCLTSVVADDGDALHVETEFICDSAGKTVARKTAAFGTPVSSRFDIAGLGEIRPEEGIFLLRLPVGGTVHVEEAWSLETGERLVEESGYVFNDARGSILAKTSFSSEAPTVNEEADYDAWGATARISELDAPQHQFTGVEPDPVIGIYHFGVRAYDPTLRRWLSPDPLFLVDPARDEASGTEWNLYQYAGNNPVMLLDPTGMSTWDDVKYLYGRAKDSVKGWFGFTGSKVGFSNYHEGTLDIVRSGGNEAALQRAVDRRQLGAEQIAISTSAMAATGELVGLATNFTGSSTGSRTGTAVATTRTGAKLPDKLYHYADEVSGALIDASQLGRPGRPTYLTPNGFLAPVQAGIELALPVRNTASAVFEVTTRTLDPGLVIRVGRVTGNVFGRGGGGVEIVYDGMIPRVVFRRVR